MGFFRKIENENGLIGIWKLTETPAELLGEVRLSAEELRRYENMKVERRQTEYLATRLLLTKILGNDATIVYNGIGKPFLKNQFKNISISHSINFVTVFISDQKIGIDVELATRSTDRVTSRFLHPDEEKYISGLQNQQLAKIVYWSAKEAIFKSTEEQGIQFNKQIIINNFNPDFGSHFSAQLLFSEKILKYQLTYVPVENNVMVYCVQE